MQTTPLDPDTSCQARTDAMFLENSVLELIQSAAAEWTVLTALSGVKNLGKTHT